MVCNAVCDYWLRLNNEDSVVKVRKAYRSASAKLDDSFLGMNHVQMGTTLVIASIDDHTITITHCGDSRCYLIRKYYFTYKPERAVPDIAQFEIKYGDRILLCSDGLYKSIPPKFSK